MSTYGSDLIGATCTINRKDFDNLKKDIQKEVVNWTHFGWQQNVINANSLEDIAKEFDITLYDEGNDEFRPSFRNTYMSCFFEKLAELSAPYMSNGKIMLDEEDNVITVTFKNKKVSITSKPIAKLFH